MNEKKITERLLSRLLKENADGNGMSLDEENIILEFARKMLGESERAEKDSPDLTMCTFDELYGELAARSDSIVMACQLSADADEPMRLRLAGEILIGRGLLVELNEYAREIAKAERNKSK